MSIVPMSKIGIIAHASDFARMTERLAELGIVQIVRREGDPGDSPRRIEAEITAIERALAFLGSKIDKRPSTLKTSIHGLRKLAVEFPCEEKLNETESLRRSIEEMSSRRNTLDHEISSLEPYSPINFDLYKLNAIGSIEIRLGFIPRMFESALEGFTNELCEKAVINSDPNGFYVVFVFHKSIVPEIDEFLDGSDFAEFHFEQYSELPAECLARARSERAAIIERLALAERETADLAERLIPTLEAIRGFRVMELAQACLLGNTERTKQTLFLTGWAKTSEIVRLRESISAEFDAVEIAEIPPEEGEEPPVALKNPPVIEAFEIITDLYGRPRAGMIDPTPFIAPFFPLFFGLCLTDAGYGLLLILFSGGMLAFGKSGEGTRKFMRFILYSGIATVIIGAMAGGWFGIDLPSMDNAVARALLSVKLFDPLGNAIEFFAASVFLGVLQVSVGFILSGVIGVREASGGVLKARAGLLALSWVAVTVGAGVFIANYLIPEAMAAFLPIGVNSLKFGALGIVVFSFILGIAGKRGIGSSIGDGLGFDGLYGIVNLFGDLLSYARILALGLSTGVIAGVINIIAGQISSMIPGVGIVFAALLVIVGHVGYTGLSALGAFVHPARLHFVEYFTKFYEAGGEPFEPLERKIEGVEIVE